MKRQRIPRGRKRMLQVLFERDANLSHAAEVMGVKVDRLARVVDDEQLLRTITLLRLIGGLWSEQTDKDFRFHAKGRLLELSQTTDSPETARKACVDILNHTQTVDDPMGRLLELAHEMTEDDASYEPEVMTARLRERGLAGMLPSLRQTQEEDDQ